MPLLVSVKEGPGPDALVIERDGVRLELTRAEIHQLAQIARSLDELADLADELPPPAALAPPAS